MQTRAGVNRSAGQHPGSVDWADVDLEARPQTYPPGVDIFGQGDEVAEVFFLIRGFVKVSRVQEDGATTIIALAADGWLLGVSEAVGGGRFHGTASTLVSCSLVRMPRDRFLARLEEDSDFSLRVHQAQAMAFRIATRHFCVVSRQSVRSRILHFVGGLLRAQEGMGRIRQLPCGEHRVELPFRQWELAQFLGTTPEHLSRTLKTLGDEGVVSSRKGWLYVRSDFLCAGCSPRQAAVSAARSSGPTSPGPTTAPARLDLDQDHR